MRVFKEKCDSAGKNVVFLCHTKVEKMETIDIEGYNVLDLQLNRYSRRWFVDHVDCVAFLRLKLYDQRGGDEKVVLSSNERQLICHSHATVMSKNRFEIEEALDCPIDSNPIVDFLKNKMKEKK